MSQENPSRDRILRRIERALAKPASPPWTHTAADPSQAVFAPISDPLARFRQECAANRTELHVVARTDLARTFHGLLIAAGLDAAEAGESAPRLYAQSAPAGDPAAAAVFEELLRPWASHVDGPASGPPDDRHTVGFTMAEALIARTGSVLLSTAQGGRAASVLPPIHIVYARATQLAAELDEALALLQTAGPAPARSMYSLITGPSRTADIEKMLVLGAHGPKRLVILLEI